MLKFFSGLVSGVLLVVIVVVCCLFAVPMDSYTNMAGVSLPEGTEIKGMSIIDAGKTAIDLVQNMNTKSMNDIKKTFGVDVFGIIKNALEMDPNDTTFDAVADAKIPDIGTEFEKIPVKNMLTITGIKLNDNITEIITPILENSIFDLVDPSKETESKAIVDSVVNGIKIRNVRNFGNDILPNIPLFAPANDEKELMGLFKDPSKLKVGDFVDTTIAGTAKVLVAIKDCTLLPDPENPTNYIADKIMNIPVEQIMPDNLTANPMLDSLKTKTINELANVEEINKIKIGEFIGVKSTDTEKHAVLRAIADITIGDITKDPTKVMKAALDTIHIKDIIEIPKDSLLDKLKIGDSTISSIAVDIQGAIETVKIGDLFPEFKVEPGKEPTTLPAVLHYVDAEGNKHYLGDWTIKELTTKTQGAIQNLTLGTIIPNLTDTDLPGSLKTISGVKFADWKLSELSTNIQDMNITGVFVSTIDQTKPGYDQTLLWELTHDGETEIIMTLKGAKGSTSLEERLQVVVNNATLNDLQRWGMLSADLTDSLSTPLGSLGTSVGLDKTSTLGSLKIAEVIKVVAKAIETINAIPIP